MIYLCYFILFFAALRLLIAVFNLISAPYLPSGESVDTDKLISILIPARNEEKNLDMLLNDLKDGIDRPNEIIIYDDLSRDNTPEVIEKHAEQNPYIRHLSGHLLPAGWLGKNHACHNLALEAKGDYLLFLDADVRIQPGLINSAIRFLEKKNLQLVSIFPRQIMLSMGEKISVPLMNWILLSLLPLALVRLSRWTSFSAANGQFMLFRASAYKQMLPHEKFRLHPVEDIAILRRFKKAGFRTSTLLGNKEIECRMYTGLKDATEGFARNFLYFFGNSIIIALLFGIISSFGLIVLLIFGSIELALVYLFLVIILRVVIAAASKQSVGENLLYMIPQQLVLLIIISKAIIKRKKHSIVWKERNILS